MYIQYKPRETKVRKVFIFQLFSTQSPPIRTHLSQEGGVNYSVARWPKFRPESSKGAEKKRFGRKNSWPNFPKNGRKGAGDNVLKKFLILK
jgi:hypothetical protein